jgi:tRNA threonylcarbamoyl adenosine modification protein YjeE
MDITQALEFISAYVATEQPVVFLQGPLGAGKTYLTNQFAKTIAGITTHLPSPTFTFLQEYKCDWNGKKRIVHCDFYRIETQNAEKVLEQIGFWDYIDSSTIVFIEWPEKAGDIVSALPHMTVNIHQLENGERNYECTK